MATQKPFILRRLVSFTTLLCFIMLAFTGVVLFIQPHGRVAYWSGWTLFGLGKDQWEGVHTAASILFLICGVLHLTYNWRSVARYLGMKGKGQRKLRGREAAVALVLAGLFVVGAAAGFPPFDSLMAFGDGIKRSWETPADSVAAPFGRADQASVNVICQRVGLDLERALARLREAKMRTAGGQQTLAEIASANNIQPQDVFKIMQGEDMIFRQGGGGGGGGGRGRGGGGKGALSSSGKGAGAGQGKGALSLPRLGAGTGRGVGRMSLAEACSSVGVTPEQGRQALAGLGIQARPGQTMRDLASNAGMRPGQLLRQIQGGR